MTKTTQRVSVEGVNEALRACNKLGRDANKALRAATREIADETAQAAQRRGVGLGAMQALAASSIRSGSDRVPKVVGGGAKRVGKRRNPVGAFFFGAEFGGARRPTTQQFAPHLGQQGYFLWPTIRARKGEDIRKYQHALDRVCADWGGH